MKRIIFLLTPFIISFSFAQSKHERNVAIAVEELKNAMIHANSSMLERYTSEKLSYGHSSGKVEGQESFIQSLTSGASDFVTIDLTEQTIFVNGKTAIVRHKLSATTNDAGKPGSVKLSILLVWQRENGEWKLLARQSVKLV